ncbi:MAG: hypothetical protein JST09_10300 [Bacteroidetes bacterium]|nr:hypothetical protein [Bacteroidota bacterium]
MDILIDAAGGQNYVNDYVYPMSAFKDLTDKIKSGIMADEVVDSIRIYFAAFNENTSSSLAFMEGISDKQVVFIFAPKFKKTSNSAPATERDYFVLSQVNSAANKISVQRKEDWINYYYSEILNTQAGLNTTIDNADDNNKIDEKTLSDTRSVSYKYSDFTEFLCDEVNYQNTMPNIKVKIKKIKICFAAYPITGIGSSPNYPRDEDNFKNRLIIQFEYIKNNNSFYIDDAPGFSRRHRTTVLMYNKLSGKKFDIDKGFDTGNLCPPNCPH